MIYSASDLEGFPANIVRYTNLLTDWLTEA